MKRKLSIGEKINIKQIYANCGLISVYWSDLKKMYDYKTCRPILWRLEILAGPKHFKRWCNKRWCDLQN